METSPMTLKISGEAFKSGYYVYVIVAINRKNERNHFLYVGQTGDRNYITARSPVYRLIGHLEQRSKSTQNQLFKGACKRLGLDSSNPKVSGAFERKIKAYDIFLHSFLTAAFDYQHRYDETAEGNARHTEKRILAERIERQLIHDLEEKMGTSLINKKKTRPKIDDSRIPKVRNSVNTIVSFLSKTYPRLCPTSKTSVPAE